MRLSVVFLTTVLVLGVGDIAAGQQPAALSTNYEREVFEYSPAGRPDPFRSLLDGDLGVRIEDLALMGVLFHPDPSMSVAILSQVGSQQRLQARVGERVGTVRVMAIRPQEVDVQIEELGVARRETLRIRAAGTQRPS